MSFPEEPLDSPNGYFAAQPNQKLQAGRWTIVRKLGWGPRSSTWLALDAQDEDKFCAVKIFTVSATTDQSAANERDLFESTLKFPIMTVTMPEFRGSFEEKAPKGIHLCLLFENIGPSVEALRLSNTESGGYLPLHSVKKIVADVIEILDEVHGQGIVHGALCADNLLLLSASGAALIRDRLEKIPTAPVEGVITGDDGAVYPIVRSQPIDHFFKWNDTRSDFACAAIYLSNFGHAYEATKANDFKHDIWALGVMTYHLLTGTPLFPGGTDDSGPVADSEAEAVISKLEDLLTASGKLLANDVPQTASFIRACLTLDIKQRPTAYKLFSYDWVKGVVRPVAQISKLGEGDAFGVKNKSVVH